MTLFHFTSRDTPIHRADARVKLLALALVTVATFLASFPALAVISLMVLTAVGIGRMSPASVLWRGRVFVVLVAVVVVSRAISTRYSGAGWPAGLQFGSRLLLSLLTANLFASTTSPSDLRQSIVRLVGILPGVNAASLGLLVMITASLVPALFETAQSARMSLRARGLRPVARPFRSVRITAAVLMRRSLQRAMNLSYAIEARCFVLDRSHAMHPSPARQDIGTRERRASVWLLAGSLGCLAAAIVL